MDSRYNDIRQRLREQFGERVPGDLLDEVIAQVDEHFHGGGKPVPGDEVSVDVSTGEEDAHRRIFATIESSQEDPEAQGGRIWLARMDEDSFGLIGEASNPDAVADPAPPALQSGEAREQFEAMVSIPEGIAWSPADQDYRLSSDDDFWQEAEGKELSSWVIGQWAGFRGAWRILRGVTKATSDRIAVEGLVESARCLGVEQVRNPEAAAYWESKVDEYRARLYGDVAPLRRWIPCSEREPDFWAFCDWLYPPNPLKNERWVLVGESKATASVPGEATHWRAHELAEWQTE